jgi:hypothetical protein
VVRVGRAWRRGVRAFDRWRNSMVDGCILGLLTGLTVWVVRCVT